MYIKVLVTPGVKKESAVKKSKAMFEIKIREPAERNQANNRVREIVAKYFNVHVGKVKIISGHHSPSKMLDVDTKVLY